MSRTIETIMAHTTAPRKRERAPANDTRLTAHWQTGLETISGFAQRKLALFFAPSQLDGRQPVTEEDKNMSTTLRSNESHNKSRILIVDNNRQFTQSARLFLEHIGHYTVCEVNDPRRALESARSFKPDLALLALIMPQQDGIAVAAQLEADWALHEVPIVFVTALITPEEANDGRRIEGHRVVAKPVNAFNLLKIIEENTRRCAAA